MCKNVYDVTILWLVLGGYKADDFLASKEGADMLDQVIAHASLPPFPSASVCAPVVPEETVAPNQSQLLSNRFALERVHSNPPAGQSLVQLHAFFTQTHNASLFLCHIKNAFSLNNLISTFSEYLCPKARSLFIVFEKR